MALALNSKDIKALLLKGNALRYLHKKKEAMECFDKVLVIENNNEEALAAKGTLSLELEEWVKNKSPNILPNKELVVQENSNVVVEGNDDSTAQQSLPNSEDRSMAYLLEQGHRLLINHQFDEAITWYDLLINELSTYKGKDKNKWYAEAYQAKGRVCFADGSYEEAIRFFDLAWSKDRKNINTLLYKSWVFISQGAYKPAITCCEENKNQSLQATYLFALLLANQFRKFQPHLKTLENSTASLDKLLYQCYQLVNKKPNQVFQSLEQWLTDLQGMKDAWAHLMPFKCVIQILIDYNDLENAEIYLNKLLAITHKDSECLNLKVKLEKKINEQKIHVLSAQTLTPEQWLSVILPTNMTIDDLAYKKAFEMAEQIPGRLIQKEVKAKLWSKKGNCLMVAGQYALAIDCFDEIIKLSFATAHTWCSKSFCFRKLLQFNEAMVCCVKAFSISQTRERGKIWHEKGAIYYELGSYEDALFCAEKICELGEDNTELKLPILLKIGRFAEHIALANRELQKGNTHISTFADKSIALMLLGNYKEALVCINQGLEIDKTNYDLIVHKAFILLFPPHSNRQQAKEYLCSIEGEKNFWFEIVEQLHQFAETGESSLSQLIQKKCSLPNKPPFYVNHCNIYLAIIKFFIEYLALEQAEVYLKQAYSLPFYKSYSSLFIALQEKVQSLKAIESSSQARPNLSVFGDNTFFKRKETTKDPVKSVLQVSPPPFN